MSVTPKGPSIALAIAVHLLASWIAVGCRADPQDCTCPTPVEVDGAALSPAPDDGDEAVLVQQVDTWGAGMTIAEAEGEVVVRSFLRHSRAFRSGLREGARLRLVDGRAVDALGLDGVALTLQGPPGSSVTLTALQSGSERDFTFERVRMREWVCFSHRGTDATAPNVSMRRVRVPPLGAQVVPCPAWDDVEP